MTEEKPAKDDAVEKNGVEPDKPPTRKLAVLIAVLTVLVVLAIVGLWRLLIYQTRIERELKANPETAEVKELNKQTWQVFVLGRYIDCIDCRAVYRCYKG